MSFLLDNNILSVYLTTPGQLTHYFHQHSGHLYTSSIAAAELYVWAYAGRGDPARRCALVSAMFADEVAVLPFEVECAEWFGYLHAVTRASGTTVPAMDLMIAASALVYGLVMVTHNVRHFTPVPDLQVVDWLAP